MINHKVNRCSYIKITIIKVFSKKFLFKIKFLGSTIINISVNINNNEKLEPEY